MAKHINLLMLLSSTFLIIIFSSGLAVAGRQKGIPFQAACNPLSFSGEVDFQDKTAFFEGRKINLPEIALREDSFSVLSVAHEERWIEIDLSDQRLKAWEGNNLFLETAVSTGLPWWATPEGEFRIWIKLRAAKMEGGSGRYYYYLPNVPYVMYFENEKIPGWKGYGLHGTYWHDDFGTPRSHGCVNLPTPIARQLYYWVTPSLSKSKWVAQASQADLGTKVVIHK